MQKDRKQLEELFQKYQQGLVTEEEKIWITRWLVQLDVMEHLTPEQLQARQELSKNDLKSHFFPKESLPSKVIRFPVWLRSVAASICIIAVLAGIFYFNSNKPRPATFQEMTTQTGEMKMVTLADGTRITLNNESKLKYPDTFNGKIREVYLTGEAFFDVVHNSSQPFKVHTDQLDIQVLGTSFNVKAYLEDQELSVAVATGKVGVLSIAAKTKAYMLLPGDHLGYNRSTGKFIQSKVDAVNIMAWQKGIFIFKDETLENITRQLGRYYKINFKFNNKSLLTKQISMKIKKQSISTVIKALSISGEFQYKLEGDQVTIW